MQLVVIATCYSLGSGYFSWTGNVPLVPLLSFYIAIASSAFFFFSLHFISVFDTFVWTQYKATQFYVLH